MGVVPGPSAHARDECERHPIDELRPGAVDGADLPGDDAVRWIVPAFHADPVVLVDADDLQPGAFHFCVDRLIIVIGQNTARWIFTHPHPVPAALFSQLLIAGRKHAFAGDADEKLVARRAVVDRSCDFAVATDGHDGAVGRQTVGVHACAIDRIERNERCAGARQEARDQVFFVLLAIKSRGRNEFGDDHAEITLDEQVGGSERAREKRPCLFAEGALFFRV